MSQNQRELSAFVSLQVALDTDSQGLSECFQPTQTSAQNLIKQATRAVADNSEWVRRQQMMKAGLLK